LCPSYENAGGPAPLICDAASGGTAASFNNDTATANRRKRWFVAIRLTKHVRACAWRLGYDRTRESYHGRFLNECAK
jgi:hypothetical protein